MQSCKQFACPVNLFQMGSKRFPKCGKKSIKAYDVSKKLSKIYQRTVKNINASKYKKKFAKKHNIQKHRKLFCTQRIKTFFHISIIEKSNIIIIWPWGSNWTIWSPQNLFLQHNFPFLKGHMQHLPFPACRGKEQLTAKPKSKWHQWVNDPGAFELDHLQSMKPMFATWISTLLTGHKQHFAFPACRGKRQLTVDPKVNDTNGYMTLGHSNWTI